MDNEKKVDDFKSVGRPPAYKTAEELTEKIDEYFNEGVKTRSFLLGHGATIRIETIPVPTISGLALFLGFSSRQSFYDYEKNTEFSYTIRKARLFIETEYEEQLQVGNTTGAIFALKNLGWHDKSEVVNKNLNSKELTDEEITELSKKLDDEY